MTKDLEWHNKTSHTRVDRYIKFADRNTRIPMFDKSIIHNLKCIPCIFCKSQKAPVKISILKLLQPIQE